MDETKRWSEGMVGFGSATSAEVLEKLTATHRRLLEGTGQPAPEDAPAPGDAHQRESSAPGAPALNRRQRRALARGKAPARKVSSAKALGPSRRR